MPEPTAGSLGSTQPSAADYEAAIATVRARYPEDIFPPNSPSLDARTGTFARSLCDQIVALAVDATPPDIARTTEADDV